ncbi:hypothetical protein [Emticicia agri]|uniref:Uncharacterized protein n=1 Tax=Emticicia agri TaxID=2492393 RepID=A0A4Q5M1C2_9BACT|nr:hypothetical protein [Emticicia agri]RYU95845.1 hypothetical protein EWM59_09475 [Emticicia agri]
MRTSEQRLDFYKELFYKEVDRRKDFNNAIIIPITLLTGVFSIIFYLISAYKFSYWGVLSYGFVILLAASSLIFIICAFHTIRFYSNIDAGFQTIELPRPNEIEDYRKSLLNYHKKASEVEEVFNDWLIEQYIMSTTNYQVNNDLKANHFFQFKKYFFYGLIALFLCGILFIQNLIANRSENEEKQKFYINLKIESSLNKIDTTILADDDSLTLLLK